MLLSFKAYREYARGFCSHLFVLDCILSLCRYHQYIRTDYVRLPHRLYTFCVSCWRLCERKLLIMTVAFWFLTPFKGYYFDPLKWRALPIIKFLEHLWGLLIVTLSEWLRPPLISLAPLGLYWDWMLFILLSSFVVSFRLTFFLYLGHQMRPIIMRMNIGTKI